MLIGHVSMTREATFVFLELLCTISCPGRWPIIVLILIAAVSAARTAVDIDFHSRRDQHELSLCLALGVNDLLLELLD